MQCKSRISAVIRHDAAIRAPIVNRLAAHRMSKLGQMNANLVRAACLQSARKQCIARQFLFHGNVRDRFLALPGIGGAAATPISPIARQEGF